MHSRLDVVCSRALLFGTAVLIGTIALSPAAWAAFSASSQSRPPISSGATGGANPGGAGGGYNPGSNGGGGNSGGGYNPGQGGGYNPGGNSNAGGGYNPGQGNGTHRLTVYRDANFRGRSVRFASEIRNLQASGFNDVISSMQVQGEWQACTDAYFRGRCVNFHRNALNLQASGMNDRISSLRPIRR